MFQIQPTRTFTILTCSKQSIGTARKGAYVGLHIDCHVLTSCLSHHGFGFKGTHKKHSAHASSHCEQRHRRCHGQRKRGKRGQEDQTQASQTEALTKRQAPIDTTLEEDTAPVARRSVHIQNDNKP